MNRESIPYSATVTKISGAAAECAQRFGSAQIRPEDMLFALLDSDSLMLDGFWKQKGVLPQEIKSEMAKYMTASQKPYRGDMMVSQETQMLANRATQEAAQMKCRQVDEGHLLMACAEPTSNWISSFLREQKHISEHEVSLYVVGWHHGLGGHGGALKALNAQQHEILKSAANLLGEVGATHGSVELARVLHGVFHDIDGGAINSMQNQLGSNEQLQNVNSELVQTLSQRIGSTASFMGALRNDCKERFNLGG